VNQQKVLKNDAGAENTERGSVVGTSNDSNDKPIDTLVPSLDGVLQKQRHQGQKVDESEQTILEYFLATSNKPPKSSDLHFLRGLLPHTEGLSQQEKLKISEFQKGILNLILNIYKERASDH
jgi:hypothetical protein